MFADKTYWMSVKNVKMEQFIKSLISAFQSLISLSNSFPQNKHLVDCGVDSLYYISSLEILFVLDLEKPFVLTMWKCQSQSKILSHGNLTTN